MLGNKIRTTPQSRHRERLMVVFVIAYLSLGAWGAVTGEFSASALRLAGKLFIASLLLVMGIMVAGGSGDRRQPRAQPESRC